MLQNPPLYKPTKPYLQAEKTTFEFNTKDETENSNETKVNINNLVSCRQN